MYVFHRDQFWARCCFFCLSMICLKLSKIIKKIALFADDTTILTSGNNLEIEEKLNNDLKKIENWSSRNKLVIDSKKCKIAGFGRNVQKSKNLLLGGVLEEVN